MVTQFLISVVLKGALAEILGKIVKFQLIVHLLLVNTPTPANVLNFYKTLIPIVTFELFPTTRFFDKYMPDLDYDKAYTDTFALFEYDILYLLPLLGFMLVTLLLIPFSLVLS